MHPRTLAAALLTVAALVAAPLAAQDSAATATDSSAEKKPKVNKLFSTYEPIEFRLTADFKSMFRRRDTIDVKRSPAVLSLLDDDGKPVDLPIEAAPRGHFRLMARNCSFPPIKLNVPKGGAKNTAFAGQGGLKLGTHCQKSDDYEQLVLREHLAYTAHNLITPMSFRTRLAKITYVEAKDTTEKTMRWGLLIEDEEDMAKRLGGKLLEQRQALFTDVDSLAMGMMAVFEYFLGNTDWSMYSLHNVRLVQTPEYIIYPIAYDFDHSGLVDARYANPDPRLPIKTVRQRLHRGPCRTAEELKPIVAAFNAQRQAIDSIYANLPGLEAKYSKWARGYIAEFYETINDPKKLKREIMDRCSEKPSA